MNKRTRRNHIPALRAKVALAAIKGDKTLSVLATQFDVHPTRITQWKETPADQQGLDGEEVITGVARIEPRDDGAESLLQYVGRVHDEVPRGWSPRETEYLVMHAVSAVTTG